MAVDLVRLAEVVKGMSPGVWRAYPGLNGHMCFPIVSDDLPELTVVEVSPLANILAGYGKDRDSHSRSPEGQPAAWSNAAGIVALRNAAADLIAELTALRDALAQIRAHGDGWSARIAKAALGEVTT